MPVSPPDPPFSSRIPTNPGPNALTRALAARRARGDDVLDLTVSNPTRVGLPGPSDAALAQLATPATRDYAPEPPGLLAAREAVVAYYRDLGIKLDADQVCLTCSTSEAYTHLFRLLAEPGDAVAVPQPGYPLFESLARLAAVRLQPYRLDSDGAWYVNRETLAAACREGVRAVIAVNPNNPTGNYARLADHTVDITGEQPPPLIVDEVFGDFAWTDRPRTDWSLAGTRSRLTFTVSGLSKLCGLPQMKLAWIVVNGPPPLVARAIARLEAIGDTYLSVATPTMLAAPAFLTGRHRFQAAVRQRLRGNLETLRQRVVDTAVSVLSAEGGWYAMLRLPAVMTDEAWALQLLDRGVYVHPGYLFDTTTEAFLVPSLLTPPEVFQEGCLRLVEAVGDALHSRQ